MDFGINLATSADSWRIVKRAEELGYARAWFYDTQMLNADMFVAMRLEGISTPVASRIREVCTAAAPIATNMSALSIWVS